MKITIDLSRENAEKLANFLLCKGDYAMTTALSDHIGKQVEAQLPKPVVTFKPGDVVRSKGTHPRLTLGDNRVKILLCVGGFVNLHTNKYKEYGSWGAAGNGGRFFSAVDFTSKHFELVD